MTAEQVLAAHGIQRPAEVVELARAAGLELAAAATMLEKESSGGLNLWGHDPVDTGGFYVKGDEVTEDAYKNYKAHRAHLGCQGVGPTQLTFAGFQDQADDEGGCYDWRVNCKVGFGILAQNIRAEGSVREGFRAYNGSGQGAEDYASDAMTKLGVWQSRLGTSGGHPPMQPLHQGDTGPAVGALQTFLNDTFPLYSHLDLDQQYGPQTAAVVAEFQRRAGVTGPGVDVDGRTVGPLTWAALERFGFH